MCADPSKFHFVLYLIYFLEHDKARTITTWWCHQMETFSALLALCVGISPATGEFPTQRPVTSVDVFFDLQLDQYLRLQWRPGYLRRHRAHYDATVMIVFYVVLWNVCSQCLITTWVWRNLRRLKIIECNLIQSYSIYPALLSMIATWLISYSNYYIYDGLHFVIHQRPFH